MERLGWLSNRCTSANILARNPKQVNLLARGGGGGGEVNSFTPNPKEMVMAYMKVWEGKAGVRACMLTCLSVNTKEFYMSGCDKNAATELEIMWTNQHGTGPKTDDIVETQVILQYMCQAYPSGKVNDIYKDFQLHTIRNGGNRITQRFRRDQREDRLIRKDRGLHEPKEYYNAYVRRERNKGEMWRI